MKELAPEHLHWRYDKKTNGSSQSFHPFHQVLGWHSIWQIEGGCSRHLAGWHPLCPDCTGHMGWPIQTVHEGGSYRCKPLDYCLWFQLVKFVSECFLFILSKVTISFIFWWFLRNIHCLSKYLCLGVWSCTLLIVKRSYKQIRNPKQTGKQSIQSINFYLWRAATY